MLVHYNNLSIGTTTAESTIAAVSREGNPRSGGSSASSSSSASASTTTTAESSLTYRSGDSRRPIGICSSCASCSTNTARASSRC